MAPTSGRVTFFNTKTKQYYERSEDIYGALFITVTLRELRQKKSISKSARENIISRLKRKTDEYEKFKSDCPEISLENIKVMEEIFNVSIYIWSQNSTRDVPVCVLRSDQSFEMERINLLSKTFTPNNPDLT